MKAGILLLVVALSFASQVSALEPAELDNRIASLGSKLDAMQRKPDKAIPAENLRTARGIVLLDRTKAGFIFAYQGGSGVAMVRDSKTDAWGPAAFVSANEASLGFQIGGEQTFVVILLMDTNATRLLTEANAEVGGEARGTAGDQTSAVGGSVPNERRSILIYDDRKGLYGGAAVKGGAISPDDEANRIYYRQPITLREILFGDAVKPTESAARLADKLNGLAVDRDSKKKDDL